MPRLNILVVAKAVLPILLMSFGEPLMAHGRSAGPDYTRRVNRPFATVLAAVEKSASEHGFRVSGHHNVAASLMKAGMKRGPYMVVEVCNARIAARVLAAEPRLGALMPCRIAVYQEGPRTVVSTVLPSRLAALYHNPRALAAARPVDHELRLIINDALKED